MTWTRLRAGLYVNCSLEIRRIEPQWWQLTYRGNHLASTDSLKNAKLCAERDYWHFVVDATPEDRRARFRLVGAA